MGRRVSFGSWSYDLDLRAGAGAVYLCPLAAVSLFPPPPRRDFIVQRYVELKKAHPNLPILIRECSEVQPKLWARYAFGQEKTVSLNNLSADEVTRAMQNVLSGKA